MHRKISVRLRSVKCHVPGYRRQDVRPVPVREADQEFLFVFVHGLVIVDRFHVKDNLFVVFVQGEALFRIIWECVSRDGDPLDAYCLPFCGYSSIDSDIVPGILLPVDDRVTARFCTPDLIKACLRFLLPFF